MRNVWQLRLHIYMRCQFAAQRVRLVLRWLTAYLTERFSQQIEPEVGHAAGGLGSMYSGGSVGKSEYSLMRSSATCQHHFNAERRVDFEWGTHHSLLDIDPAPDLGRRNEH
jgi:hypothetical protein